MIGRRWPFHVFALVGIAPIVRRNASLSFCPCRLGDKDRRGRDGRFIDERSGRKRQRCTDISAGRRDER